LLYRDACKLASSTRVGFTYETFIKLRFTGPNYAKLGLTDPKCEREM